METEATPQEVAAIEQAREQARIMMVQGWNRHRAVDALAALHREALDPAVKRGCAKEIAVLLGIEPQWFDACEGVERVSLGEWKRRVAGDHGEDSPEYRVAYAAWAAAFLTN